ncbi:MAG TPA: beta-propeller fold lactonase family protein [Acidobacteriaceae bacterium]|nr:beta-propeller fold lactonase family protein [Acidobacteriaceae bacterium]
MKRYRIGRAALATMMSLALGLGVTACSRDYTVAFVYATSAQGGGVSAFNVDYQSGSLVQIAGSPFTSGMRNPVTLVVAPNQTSTTATPSNNNSGKFLYVIGGTQDDAVAEMAIGTDGKLFGQHTYNITGHGPTAAAIDPSGHFLYVTFTYQNGYTTASPGPGGVTIFPINADNSLGTPATVNVGNNPVGVVASALNHFVYVLDADVTPAGVGNGQVLGFSQNPSTGALTPVPGTVITTVGGKTVATGVSAGTTPTAIAEEQTARFVYVTDRGLNQMLGYQVTGSTSPGTLVPLISNPFITGQYPVAITIDPRGKFIYVANFGSSTISSYAIDPASGNPSGVAGTGNSQVSTGPTCVTIEPALGIYLFASTQLSGQISGAQLDPHTGALTTIENSPFDAGPLLSCAAAAANGEHSSSLVNP